MVPLLGMGVLLVFQGIKKECECVSLCVSKVIDDLSYMSHPCLLPNSQWDRYL